MRADANELCRVGHILAQVELIQHCSWKLDLATPTQVLALVWWKAVHQLRELIYLKSKATRRGNLCILLLEDSMSAALTGRIWGQEHRLLGEAGGGSLWLCRLLFSQTCHWNHICKCFPPPPEIGTDAFWSTFSGGTSELGSVLLMEKGGLEQVVRCVLGNHGEIEFFNVFV